MGQNETDWILSHHITELANTDLGLYRCHAITSYDSVSSGAANIRLIEQTVISRNPSNITVKDGDVAQFRYSFTSLLH